MPDEEKEGGGRRVYSRLGGGEGDERPPAKAGAKADAAGGAGAPTGAQWRVLVTLVRCLASVVSLIVVSA